MGHVEALLAQGCVMSDAKNHTAYLVHLGVHLLVKQSELAASLWRDGTQSSMI